MEVPPLRERVWSVILIGWCIAAIRLLLDFLAPDSAFTMYFGLYYTIPLVVVWIGVTRKWGTIGWRPMALTMLVLAAAIWGVASSVAYTVGQFMEWTHGRFAEGRAAPVDPDPMMKVVWGVLHGLGSTAFSFVILVVVGSLFVWVPRRTIKGG